MVAQDLLRNKVDEPPTIYATRSDSLFVNGVDLTDWEKEILENTGNIRWQSNMHFTSVDYVRAGFLIKKKGTWTITPEGEDALKRIAFLGNNE